MIRCNFQDVSSLFVCDGTMGSLLVLGQLQTVRWIKGNQPGTVGLAEYLLHDHPELGDMGKGHASLVVQNGLQMNISYIS